MFAPLFFEDPNDGGSPDIIAVLVHMVLSVTNELE